MPRDFYPATAEQVVASVDAVLANQKPTNADFVADFADIPRDQAESALNLSVDLGFLKKDNTRYLPMSPLCRFLTTPNEKQKAASLRIILESYEPFIVFRQRLLSTELASEAARQTRVSLELTGHHETIKDTLLSLGTYSQALVSLGGGRYTSSDAATENQLELMANSCAELAMAENRIRQQIGNFREERLQRGEIIQPLAEALIRATNQDPRGAVVRAGNAVESHLNALANRLNVNIANANGINAKLERYSQAGALPSKVVFMGKYLGHIRNAADHGVDNDVNAPWIISQTTGYEYVFVACSFIAATLNHENGNPPTL